MFEERKHGVALEITGKNKEVGKDFDLRTILTFITGINCAKKFSNCHELVGFIFDDENINDRALIYLNDQVREYLLWLYPNLRHATDYPESNGNDLEDWIEWQEKRYGNTLSIIKILDSPDYNQEKAKELEELIGKVKTKFKK